MNRLSSFLFFIIIFGFVFFMSSTGQTQALNGTCEPIKVLGTFPAPFADDENSDTTVHGLAFDGRDLWAAHYGAGKIYQLEISESSLDIKTSMDASNTNPTGLEFIGQNLYVGSIPEITKMQTKGKNIGVIKKQFVPPGTDCTGLAFDGEYLWNADFNFDFSTDPPSLGDVAFLHKLKPNGKLVATHIAPGLCPEGLAFDGEFIWHTEWCDNLIYKLNTDGEIVCSYDWIEGGHPIGLTFDGTHLWLSDQSTQMIYKISISGN